MGQREDGREEGDGLNLRTSDVAKAGDLSWTFTWVEHSVRAQKHLFKVNPGSNFCHLVKRSSRFIDFAILVQYF